MIPHQPCLGDNNQTRNTHDARYGQHSEVVNRGLDIRIQRGMVDILQVGHELLFGDQQVQERLAGIQVRLLYRPRVSVAYRVEHTAKPMLHLKPNLGRDSNKVDKYVREISEHSTYTCGPSEKTRHNPAHNSKYKIGCVLGHTYADRHVE